MNICFVCYGNTCRSPMAKYILKYLLKKENIENINVTSAGTNSHSVRPMSKGSQEQLKLHHIPFDIHYSQLFTQRLYDNNDLIVVMDSYNLTTIVNRLKTTKKIRLMRSFFDGDKDVFDPYGTNNYDITYTQIYDSCLGLLDYIKEQK